MQSGAVMSMETEYELSLASPSYDENYYQKIKTLFRRFEITNYDKEIYTESRIDPLPIHFQIGTLKFYDFRIAHIDTHNKKVLFAKLYKSILPEPGNNSVIDNEFTFIFRNDSDVLFQTIDKPIEDIYIPNHNPIQPITNQTTIEYFNSRLQ